MMKGDVAKNLLSGIVPYLSNFLLGHIRRGISEKVTLYLLDRYYSKRNIGLLVLESV